MQVDDARRCGVLLYSRSPAESPVRTRTYYLQDYLRASWTGPLSYPRVLGYLGQVSEETEGVL
jgi:hypothetical protein